MYIYTICMLVTPKIIKRIGLAGGHKIIRLSGMENSGPMENAQKGNLPF